MKRLSILAVSAFVGFGLVLFLMPAQAQVIVAVPPVDTTGAPLRDGDLITSFEVTDPDIYIINLKNFSVASGFDTIHQFNGAKRLFLNPTIFSFYGHLGGFANVRRVTRQVLDSFQTSGLFRNCETDDQRVWAVEVTGEDSGIFHHVQISGAAAVLEDPNFFKKVFCINSNEERWYAKSIFPYTRLADVPRYERDLPPAPICIGQGASIDATGRLACCSGLEAGSTFDQSGRDLSLTDLTKAVCVRPGCYYQEGTCIQAPCNPVLVCPFLKITSPVGGEVFTGATIPVSWIVTGGFPDDEIIVSLLSPEGGGLATFQKFSYNQRSIDFPIPGFVSVQLEGRYRIGVSLREGTFSGSLGRTRVADQSGIFTIGACAPYPEGCAQGGQPGGIICVLGATAPDGRPWCLPQQESGIKGTVVGRYCSGVAPEPPDYLQQCGEELLASFLLIIKNDVSGIVTQVTTDNSGKFQVQLSPGTYTITQTIESRVWIFGGPFSVEVTSGVFTDTQLFFDELRP